LKAHIRVSILKNGLKDDIYRYITTAAEQSAAVVYVDIKVFVK
jgi:hypothetical protein